jgi:LEA14-like dessication related protein
MIKTLKKNWLLLFISVAFLSSCGISKQKAQIENLGKCKFDIQSVDSIRVAGTSIQKIVKADGIDLSALPSVALGMLRKNIPLDAVIRLKIENPTLKKAAINQFQYIILFEKKQLAEGIVNQSISLDPGQSTVASVRLNTNIYELINNGDLAGFIGSNSNTKKGLFTIKIKPSINVAGKSIFYPGYITIDREVSRNILL